MTSGAAASGNSGRSPCGHTELTLECECGQAAAAWWAETKRRLAEASPSRYAAAFGPAPTTQDHNAASAHKPAEPEQLTLWAQRDNHQSRRARPRVNKPSPDSGAPSA